MELEVFFTIIQQTYSKLVISFMNRKFSCGYATHFFYSIQFNFTETVSGFLLFSAIV
jgi:hypothetical protein